MKKKRFNLKNKKWLIGFAISTTLFLAVVGLATVGFVFYYGRIFPGVEISTAHTGGLKPNDAFELIRNKFEPPISVSVAVNGEQTNTFSINLDEIRLNYDHQQTIDKAYSIGRSGNLILDAQTALNLLIKPTSIDPVIHYDESKLDEYLSVIKSQTETPTSSPSAEILYSQVSINQGKAGTSLNTDQLKQELISKLIKQDFSPTSISTTVIDPSISDGSAQTWKDKIVQIVGKSIIFKYDYVEFSIDDQQIANILSPTDSYNTGNLNQIVNEIANVYNRPAQNPTFVFANNKVTEFAPAKPGVKLTDKEVATQITNAIEQLASDENLNEIVLEPVVQEDPADFNTADVNNLGINTLIGRGTSKFRGSISSRIYNISLASSSLNGHLIKPGEVFSFNNAVGDVSILTGYKQAYVIKDGKTVLGDGGGLCQVSTTMFRAALNAGLPIMERRSHSYRVYYYEQDAGPGLDATVYSPTTDLKVKNDTPGYILIQTKTDTKNLTLTFELYGTSDGRTSSITKPVILSSTEPPEDQYVDDPTLPTGQVKQVEHSAWGAKTVFDYSVERDGETIYSKKFYSTYQPWAAVYMRGTGPTI